nr:hypothetical protein [Tanacetum cinerariifolium]
VVDVTEEESTKTEAKSWGKDKDDNNNEHDSKSKGSDQKRDTGDDNTQSDSEKGSNSEHETNENELVILEVIDAESVDKGFVGGRVGVDCYGRGVKDGNDYGMTVEYTGEESVIIETGTDLASVLVDSSSVTSTTLGFTLVTSFVTEGLILAALGASLIKVPEPLG